MAPNITTRSGSPPVTVSLQYAESAASSILPSVTHEQNSSIISRASSVFLRRATPRRAHSFSVRYSRNNTGSAQGRDENGTLTRTASTTQQWPKQKTLCSLVERTASRWLPMPNTCGPFFGASVSSITMRTTSLAQSERAMRQKIRRPRSSALQAPREKKRWNAS